MSDAIVKLIDHAVAANHKEDRRGYLGASGIGERCARKIWYGFRWVRQTHHTGRMLRLFNRGHEEEPRFLRFLRLAGAEVQEYSQRLLYAPDGSYMMQDWEDPILFDWQDVSQSPAHLAIGVERLGLRQWGFRDEGGHFAGNTDGRLRWTGVCPDGWGLLECKTHSSKSFADLTKKGVLSSKPTHYAQIMTYMGRMGLAWCLYIAVNKDTDELYIEIIQARAEIAAQLEAKALGIVAARAAPPRVTEDPSWFECRFCDYREICHYSKETERNCRSCVWAEPIEGGAWRCNQFAAQLPKEFIPQGCGKWEALK